MGFSHFPLLTVVSRSNQIGHSWWQVLEIEMFRYSVHCFCIPICPANGDSWSSSKMFGINILGMTSWNSPICWVRFDLASLEWNKSWSIIQYYGTFTNKRRASFWSFGKYLFPNKLIIGSKLSSSRWRSLMFCFWKSTFRPVLSSPAAKQTCSNSLICWNSPKLTDSWTFINNQSFNAYHY